MNALNSTLCASPCCFFIREEHNFQISFDNLFNRLVPAVSGNVPFEFKNIGVKNSLRCLSNAQIISLSTFFVPIWQVYLRTLELHFPAARIQLVSDLARHICKVSNKMI